MPEPAKPNRPDDGNGVDEAAELVAELVAQRLTIAVAESLTGGLLVAELVRIPGASATVTGGVVAYHTELKHSLLGVDSGILNAYGPVHADVAKQMAIGVRSHLEVAGRRADIGVATTGVAGPESQGGHEPGTVFIGLSSVNGAWAIPLQLTGDRDAIRAETVTRAIEAVRDLIAPEAPE